jgi:hypothetical protein
MSLLIIGPGRGKAKPVWANRCLFLASRVTPRVNVHGVGTALDGRTGAFASQNSLLAPKRFPYPIAM